MFLKRFFRMTHSSSNNIIILTHHHHHHHHHCRSFCYCISASELNKTKTKKFSTFLLQKMKLLDSLRLALHSNPSPDSLFALLNDPINVVDSSVVAQAFRSAPSADSAVCLFETLERIPHFSHTQSTLIEFAKILAESGRVLEFHNFLSAVNAWTFPGIFYLENYMDQLRCFAAMGDIESVFKLWPCLESHRKRRSSEAYNILMGLYARVGDHSEAVNTFSMMIKDGAIPNTRTYLVMIEHLASCGKLDSAKEIFDMLPMMRIKRTAGQYSVLLSGFTEIKRFDVVNNLISGMRIDGILPGQSTRLALQCMRDAGFVRDIDIDIDIDFCFSSDRDSDSEFSEVELKPQLDPSDFLRFFTFRYYTFDESDFELALEDVKFEWTTPFVCKMLRNFRLSITAWTFFNWLERKPVQFTHNVYTVSTMITLVAREGRHDLVDQLISKVKKEGIKLPFITIKFILDMHCGHYYYHPRDHARKIFREVEQICDPLPKFNIMILYSRLLESFAKGGRLHDVLDTLEEMITGGFQPDIQTFTGLMYYFALKKDLKLCKKLFQMVKEESGLEPDVYMFQVLIRAYVWHGKAGEAFKVFEDMRRSDLMPDVATRKVLVRGLEKESNLKAVAAVQATSDIDAVLPLALRGYIWRVSFKDLARVHNIYSTSFSDSRDESFRVLTHQEKKLA